MRELLVIIIFLCILGSIADVCPGQVRQSKRSIPVIKSVDIVVVGSRNVDLWHISDAADIVTRLFNLLLDLSLKILLRGGRFCEGQIDTTE